MIGVGKPRLLVLCAALLLGTAATYAGSACERCEPLTFQTGSFTVINAEDYGWTEATVEVTETEMTVAYTLNDTSTWRISWMVRRH